MTIRFIDLPKKESLLKPLMSRVFVFVFVLTVLILFLFYFIIFFLFVVNFVIH